MTKKSIAAMGLMCMLGGGLAAAATATATATATADPPLPPGGAAILTWTPQQQAWGYRNMEKIAPVRVIRRGKSVHALPHAAVQIDPSFKSGEVTYDTDRYMREFRASGVLVIKNGAIVLERYGLGRTAEDRWTSFSVAKSVTSTLIGAAIKDGKIKSLDDPVTRYIPALKGSAYKGVTVRQLVTMTSGVKWNESYTDPNSDVARVGLSILEPGVNPVVSYMRRLPREAAPGTKFVYKTGETDLAGILLSNAVGEPLAQYLSEKLWQPYGMEQDAIWVEDVAGHERGGCCISMTLRDYGRIGQFMLDHGIAGGKEVLPAGWTEDATTRHVQEPPYGYFWWIIPGGYEAEGIFGQTLSVFPEEQLVVVINSAWPAAWSRDIDAMRVKYLTAVRAAARHP
ncbi:MAG TPA: serine hydrolase [Steroidobacteraceae bacterium]|jgi:CubicO group peptidase (beta-lactamase class C family)|nr:serine hydrolase [Steroidobacteraceae bacterium]